MTVNAPPDAAFSFTPANPDVGDPVSFNAAATTDDLALPNSAYAWDLDNDGPFDDARGSDGGHHLHHRRRARRCGSR